MNTQANPSENTLIFIPDISGFTRFVNNTEIQHAKHIIEELLEILIDSNEIDLQLSEIEGDALLFYRKGKAPTAAELLAQIQRMYVNFHAHLKKYETHRICSCGACCTANDLQLKFIAHYGEVADKQVKDRSKLFGKDVIIAHRLLKNEVASDEYSLFSNNLVRACSTWLNLPEVAWSDVTQASGDYDFGTAKYCYIELDALEEHVPEPKIEDHSIPGATYKFLEGETVIEAPIELVFDVISDMGFRHDYWNTVKGSDRLNHKIMQVGSTHRCIIKENDSDPFFVAHNFNFDKNKITFVETNQKEKYAAVFTLIAIGKGLTRFNLTYFIKPNFLRILMFRLMAKKKSEKSTQVTVSNFKQYCEKLVKENRNHPNQMVLPQEMALVA